MLVSAARAVSPSPTRMDFRFCPLMASDRLYFFGVPLTYRKLIYF